MKEGWCLEIKCMLEKLNIHILRNIQSVEWNKYHYIIRLLLYDHSIENIVLKGVTTYNLHWNRTNKIYGNKGTQYQSLEYNINE